MQNHETWTMSVPKASRTPCRDKSSNTRHEYQHIRHASHHPVNRPVPRSMTRCMEQIPHTYIRQGTRGKNVYNEKCTCVRYQSKDIGIAKGNANDRTEQPPNTKVSMPDLAVDRYGRGVVAGFFLCRIVLVVERGFRDRHHGGIMMFKVWLGGG